MSVRGRFVISLITCGASLYGCGDDEKADLGSSRAGDDVGTGDESVTHDVDSTTGRTDSARDDTFSLETYYKVLCNYYTSCSPELRAAYGSPEECLDRTLQAAEVVLYGAPDLFQGPGWDGECLADLERVDCPPRQSGVDHWRAVQQHIFGALLACSRPEAIACNDRKDCWELWECSADDGSCGSCQARAPGTCRSPWECSIGDTCVDGMCVPAKPIGGVCESFDECASGRCTNVCVEPFVAGDDCSSDIDCGNFLWCDDGVCARLAGQGEPCGEELTIRGCQLGHLCQEGTCKKVGYSNVPVGGVCFLSDSCVAGAECTGSVCVQSEDACVADNHCPQGQHCDGECLPKRPDDETCDADQQCVSGYCSRDQVCEDPNPCD